MEQAILLVSSLCLVRRYLDQGLHTATFRHLVNRHRQTKLILGISDSSAGSQSEVHQRSWWLRLSKCKIFLELLSPTIGFPVACLPVCPHTFSLSSCLKISDSTDCDEFSKQAEILTELLALSSSLNKLLIWFFSLFKLERNTLVLHFTGLGPVWWTVFCGFSVIIWRYRGLISWYDITVIRMISL